MNCLIYIHLSRIIRALSAAAVLVAVSIAQPASARTASERQTSPVAGPPDLILIHGKVFTANASKPWAEAVAVRGDRIEAVGSDAEIEHLAGPKTQRVDLKSHVLLPGLTDAHVHPAPDDGALSLPLDPRAGLDPSVGEVERALKTVVAKAPQGKLIDGLIGPTVLDDSSIDRAWLDRLAPHNPVLLWGFTGHGLIANTAALRYVGIPAKAPNPPGGAYGRIGDTQRLDGRIYEYGIWNVDRALFAKLPLSALVDAYRQFAMQKAAWGITTVQTMGTDVPIDRLVDALDRAEPPIRFEIYRRYLPKHDVAESWSHALPTPKSSHVQIVGTKWILDGTPIEYGAYMRKPYADRPDARGKLDWSPVDIRRILDHALKTGVPVALHMCGDATAEVVLNQMRSLAPAAVWRAKRIVRIEHGDGLAPDLLKEAVNMGAVLIQNPTHFADPDTLLKRYGPDRMKQMQPLESALKAGIHLALGSDQNMSPASNPWLNIMFAVTDPAYPEQALTRTQAIMAYTAGGAYVSREENTRGKIAPGMLADLAVLCADPFTVPVRQLPGIKSELTLVGGKVVYDSGVLTKE